MVSKSGALVIQGGGTRGIFAAGVLDALMDENIDFECIAGTSAGCLAAYNFVSGDRGRTKRFVIECMQEKDFASFGNLLRKGSYFNFDYMFDNVPKRIPINMERFNANPILFYCGTTGLADGKAHYFEKSDPNFNDAIAASSSLPLISSPVKVGEHLFLDGLCVCPIPFRVALEKGYEKIVVVLTRHRDYRKKKLPKSELLAYKAKFRKHKKFLEAALAMNEEYNKDTEEIFELEKQGRVFVISPETPPTIGRSEKNKAKLEELYQQGFDVAKKQMADLKRFLGLTDE